MHDLLLNFSNIPNYFSILLVILLKAFFFKLNFFLNDKYIPATFSLIIQQQFNKWQTQSRLLSLACLPLKMQLNFSFNTLLEDFSHKMDC